MQITLLKHVLTPGRLDVAQMLGDCIRALNFYMITRMLNSRPSRLSKGFHTLYLYAVRLTLTSAAVHSLAPLTQNEGFSQVIRNKAPRSFLHLSNQGLV